MPASPKRLKFVPQRNGLKVLSGKTYLGCLDNSSGTHATCCSWLLLHLTITTISEQFGAKQNHGVVKFKDLKQAEYELTRVYTLVQRGARETKFHRNPDTGDYHVKHLGLEIGKIEYHKIPPRKNRYESDFQTNSLLHYDANRYDGAEIYCWNLDEDLCKYLKIPFISGDNAICLETFKRFIRARLLNPKQTLPPKGFTRKPPSARSRDPSKLSAIIAHFNYEEGIQRKNWAAGAEKIYP